MKKFLYLALGFFLVFHPGYSQERKIIAVYAGLGIASPQEENLRPAFESGFGAEFFLTRHFSVALDFAHWKGKVREDWKKLLNGDLSITPFFMIVNYFPFQSQGIRPYALLGAGAVFSRFEMADYITIPEIKVKQEVKNGAGFLAGAGVMVQAKKNISLFVETVYIYRKAPGVTTITDLNLGVSVTEFSADLSSVIVSLGLRYFL